MSLLGVEQLSESHLDPRPRPPKVSSLGVERERQNASKYWQICFLFAKFTNCSAAPICKLLTPERQSVQEAHFAADALDLVVGESQRRLLISPGVCSDMTYLIKGQAIGFGAVYDCTDDARREGDKAKRTADKVSV